MHVHATATVLVLHRNYENCISTALNHEEEQENLCQQAPGLLGPDPRLSKIYRYGSTTAVASLPESTGTAAWPITLHTCLQYSSSLAMVYIEQRLFKFYSNRDNHRYARGRGTTPRGFP
jgi:hypothetical protein